MFLIWLRSLPSRCSRLEHGTERITSRVGEPCHCARPPLAQNLDVSVDGEKVHPKFESVKAVIADGAGNLPILRITTRAHINGHGGKLTYEDHNYAERAGWKEIVIDRGKGVTLSQASQTNHDISNALTQYPADPTLAPRKTCALNWFGVFPPRSLRPQSPSLLPVLQ